MIKNILIILFGLFPLLSAAEHNATQKLDHNHTLLNKELQKAMELEKKYAKEQKFYDADSYDFKSVEVNTDSLKNVPLIEMDDPNMDSDAILGMSEDENLSW